jgi:hypothetical protein
MKSEQELSSVNVPIENVCTGELSEWSIDAVIPTGNEM